MHVLGASFPGSGGREGGRMDSACINRVWSVQLYVGLRDGMVRCFDCQRRYFTAECNLTGGRGVYVGIGKHER